LQFTTRSYPDRRSSCYLMTGKLASVRSKGGGEEATIMSLQRNTGLIKRGIFPGGVLVPQTREEKKRGKRELLPSGIGKKKKERVPAGPSPKIGLCRNKKKKKKIYLLSLERERKRPGILNHMRLDQRGGEGNRISKPACPRRFGAKTQCRAWGRCGCFPFIEEKGEGVGQGDEIFRSG